ncbi:DUF2989 domain-containing protein [Paraglaciecola sp.]|uniref:DUF2989 domain-containing protein n=1 Tax=Paraglaciecola sp. TaxID=1920173 RepID=UPI00273EE548|nr:DUF2989 domain-containing protein [Paraglaciecola sp.]MDP5030135.1 DUF2989 domain-containing protein [Paraglaciecola sp.]
MPRALLIFFVLFLLSCSDNAVNPVTGSLVMLCSDKKNEEICDLTHDGAMCSIQRANATRALIIQKNEQDVGSAYLALKELDKYKGCLENSVIAQNVKRKDDEISRFTTLANISSYQDKIVRDTKGVRPEINLWLYQKTGNPDYWESMVNGVDMADKVHPDVYTVMMADVAPRSMDKAKEIADLMLSRTDFLNDLSPEVYEFYVYYYLDSGDNFKSAIWYGLFAEYIKQNPGINSEYYGRHLKMKVNRIKKAQDIVDALVLKTNWTGLKIKDIPNGLL